jgi:hypothetical protein
MALIISKNEGQIKVVSSKDGSVNCSTEDYKSYLETLDETLLKLEGEPTRFVMQKGLSYKDQQVIKDAQIKMKGKDMSFQLSYMMEEVRLSLLDIENPMTMRPEDRIEYKKESDGRTSKALIAMLESAGIVGELFSARHNSMASLSNEAKKK